MNLSISLEKRICVALAALAVVLVIAAMVASPVLAQTKEVRKVPISPEHAVLTNGEDLYQAVCAVCHGKTAKGDGPAAGALKKAVPDLTVLARNNGGEFPSAQVLMTIQAKPPVAHGSEDMPMWGPIFRSASNDAQAALRIHNLVDYLKSIQVK